jgi:flagellar biosynthesis protein FlhG
VIPVAGGKGGVGKSLLTANLAVALAERGNRVVAVDLDLGGSNLHSFLGLGNKYPGVGDFLKARSAELADMIVATAVPDLGFIPGDGRTPFMANINFAQKLRLISRLWKLSADYVLLDLASGSAFNTLDFFRLAPRGMLVATPEHASIMNMMTFLKNFVLRVFERSFAKQPHISSVLRAAAKRSINEEPVSMAELQERIAAIDLAAGRKAAALCREYRPRVVFNLGEHPSEMEITEQIDKNLLNILSLRVDYFGFVFRDPSVTRSVRKGEAPLLHHNEGVAATNIRRIADRIEKFWEKSLTGTAPLIQKHAWEDFGAGPESADS